MTDQEKNKKEENYKKPTPLILLILIAFISGAAGGYFIQKIIPVKNSNNQPKQADNTLQPDNNSTQLPDNSSVTTSSDNDPEIKPEQGLWETEKFVTNITDPYARRFIEVEFKFLLTDKNLIPKILNNKLLVANIRHEIHMILVSKSFKDLKGVSGKIALFEEVKLRTNEILKQEYDTEAITKVLHTIWKVQ